MRVSSIVLLSAATMACGPRYVTTGPGDEPLNTEEVNAGANAASNANQEGQPGSLGASALARDVLIGEMCPSTADGRPAVLPLFAYSLGWSVDASDVSVPIERHAARSFSVYAWDGRRTGVFSVAGAADGVDERSIAIGAYAGGSPCDRAASETTFERDEGCVAAQSQCGLAVARVERARGMNRPYEEDPEPLELAAGGGCMVGDKLVVDIDGDQVPEAYPALAFLSPAREPADEVLAVPLENASCTPGFAQDQVIGVLDPRHFRGLHLLGVLDLDGDGRRELVVVYQYEEKRTWAVYSAVSTAGRLELMGEALPWPRAW